MGKTKKVKRAGRLGSRYGVGIRKRLLKIESKQQKNYKCPFCGFKRVKRKAAGLYVCRKCHAKFAGGAYLPVTLSGSIIKKTVTQKGFASKASVLEKTIEQAVLKEEAEKEEVPKKPAKRGKAEEERPAKRGKAEKERPAKRGKAEEEKPGRGKKKEAKK